MPSHPPDSPRTLLLRSTVSPRDGDRAAARTRVATALQHEPIPIEDDVHLAAALGDATGVRRSLGTDRARARASADPFHWDALTHLCFSVLLEAPDRPDRDFVGAARALLEAGADANTGFRDPKAAPDSAFRSVLYGAAALARHAELSRLLLEHGADPNDDEVAYHAAEGYENHALQVVVECGRISRSATLSDLVGHVGYSGDVCRSCPWRRLCRFFERRRGRGDRTTTRDDGAVGRRHRVRPCDGDEGQTLRV